MSDAFSAIITTGEAVLPETIRGIRWLVPNAVRTRWRRLRRLREFPRMEVCGIPRETVLACLTSSGGQIVDVAPDASAGPQWHSFLYCVRKA